MYTDWWENSVICPWLIQTKASCAQAFKISNVGILLIGKEKKKKIKKKIKLVLQFQIQKQNNFLMQSVSHKLTVTSS